MTKYRTNPCILTYLYSFSLHHQDGRLTDLPVDLDGGLHGILQRFKNILGFSFSDLSQDGGSDSFMHLPLQVPHVVIL